MLAGSKISLLSTRINPKSQIEYLKYEISSGVGQAFCIKISVSRGGITFLAEKEEFLLCQSTDPAPYEF